jgi:DNA-binding NarL/FixJ family response regulator
LTAETRRVRVLLVDDNVLFRVGLASALAAREDLEVVAQASGGNIAIRLAAGMRPDVVLMDLGLPDLDGPAAIRAILKRSGSARIVALALTADASDIAAVLDAGACGYVLKGSPIDDVIAAVRAAASGNAWLSSPAARALLDRTGRRRNQAAYVTAPDDDLSPRELEVLQLLARGLDNNEIAAELSISPRTANHHISSVLGKLVEVLAS